MAPATQARPVRLALGMVLVIVKFGQRRYGVFYYAKCILGPRVVRTIPLLTRRTSHPCRVVKPVDRTSFCDPERPNFVFIFLITKINILNVSSKIHLRFYTGMHSLNG